MCHVFTSQRAFALLQPGADSLVYSPISLRLVLLRSCLSIFFISGHARAVSPTLLGSCDVIAGSSRHAESFLLSFTVITAASVTSSVSRFLLMSIPLDVIITHLKTQWTRNFLTLTRKELLIIRLNRCIFNSHPPPHPIPHPPLPRCHLFRFQAAPSGQLWSASTVLSLCRHCPDRRWGGRECGRQRSGGWGPLLSSAAVGPVRDSAGPQPGEEHCDHYAVPTGQKENIFLCVTLCIILLVIVNWVFEVWILIWFVCVAYLCIDVSSKIHHVLHQREETLNWGQVEAILTCKKHQSSKLNNYHQISHFISAVLRESPGSRRTISLMWIHRNLHS